MANSNDRYPIPDLAQKFAFAQSYADKMKDGKFTMPETFRPEDRDEQFYLRMANYVYGGYCLGDNVYMRNGGYMWSNNGRTVFELRAYARGQQPINKYKKIIDFRSDKGERRELDNISWENTYTFNKFRNIALAQIAQAKYRPGVRAIDTASGEARTLQYLNDRLAADPRSKALYQQVGMVPQGVNAMTQGMDMSDVDAFNALGGYRLAAEILMTDAIQASFDISGQDSLFEQIHEDLFDIGFCSALVYRQPGSSEYKIRYVDPNGVIVPRSIYKDFRDRQYCGVVERCTIASLRLQTDQLSEEQLAAAARVYAGQLSNPQWNTGWFNGAQIPRATRSGFSALRNARYDDFACDVLTLYFTAMDAEKYVAGLRRDGAPVYDRVSSDAQLSYSDQQNGKYFDNVPVQYVYKCRWIVGTDIVFDCGKDDTIIRQGSKGSKTVIHPLLVYALNEPSYVERCIPVIDDIEIAVRKKRLSMAMLPPGPGLQVDMALLEETVQIGEETYTVKQLTGIYFNTGILYHRSKNEFGDNTGGSNRPPIAPMPSQKLAELQTFITDLQTNLQILRDTLGTNDVAAGTAKTDDLLNGVANQMQQTANNALAPLFSGNREMYLNMEKSLAMKYRTAVAWGDIELQYMPGSRSLPKFIKLDKSLLDVEFYFTVEAMPSREDQQMILQYLQNLSQQGRVGDDVYFTIYNMVREGDIQKAQLLLSIEAAKADKRRQEEALKNIEAQGQQNQQVAQVSEAARGQAETQIQQAKIQLEMVASQNRMKEAAQQHEFNMIENAAKAADKTAGEVVKNSLSNSAL